MKLQGEFFFWQEIPRPGGGPMISGPGKFVAKGLGGSYPVSYGEKFRTFKRPVADYLRPAGP